MKGFVTQQKSNEHFSTLIFNDVFCLIVKDDHKWQFNSSVDNDHLKREDAVCEQSNSCYGAIMLLY